MKNLKKKCKGKSYGIRAALGLLLGTLFLGCGDAAERAGENQSERTEEGQAETGPETGKDRTNRSQKSSLGTEDTGEDSLTAFLELPEPYQQIVLYIQEGFRRYEVEGSYKAYLGSIEEKKSYFWLDGKLFEPSEDSDRKNFSCDILLERDEVRWREELVCEYDPEAHWYTFASQYEPIFSKDISYAEYEDSSYAEELLKNHAYEISIDRDAVLAVPVRYTSESGPILRDERIFYPWTFKIGEEKEHDYYVKPMTYTYWDERLDIDIEIQYVQVSLHDGQKELEDAINEKLWEAFFYDDWEKQEMEPGRQIYTDLDTFYMITREDERYLSLRIYEYGHRRGTAHPGEGETGITIDMQTGEVLTLADVVGEEYTPQLLFESGAFHCLWGWEGDDDDYWIEELKEEAGDNLSRYDDYFYLTDTGVGLITYLSRYYTNLEASYEDLGIEGF